MVTMLWLVSIIISVLACALTTLYILRESGYGFKEAFTNAIPTVDLANSLIAQHAPIRNSSSSYSPPLKNLILNENNNLIQSSGLSGLSGSSGSSGVLSGDECRRWCSDYSSPQMGALKCIGFSYVASEGRCIGTASPPSSIGYDYQENAETSWSLTLDKSPVSPMLFKPIENIEVVIDAASNSVSARGNVVFHGNNVTSHTIVSTHPDAPLTIEIDDKSPKCLLKVRVEGMTIYTTIDDSVMMAMSAAHAILSGPDVAENVGKLRDYQIANTFHHQMTLRQGGVSLNFNYSVVFKTDVYSLVFKTADAKQTPYVHIFDAPNFKGRRWMFNSSQTFQEGREDIANNASSIMVDKGLKCRPCREWNFGQSTRWFIGPISITNLSDIGVDDHLNSIEIVAV